MNRISVKMIGALCAFAALAAANPPAHAQSAEVKEKPPMYSYVSNWAIPRAQWGEIAKATAAEQKLFDTAMTSGALIGYGSDQALVHRVDGMTHDTWWSAMSMAGVLNVLDELYKAGNAMTPVLSTATKHDDNIYVSHYYNWHKGSWSNVYTRVFVYKLKQDAPDDAMDVLSQHIFVPLLEKLLADGAIHEYEIDSEAIHTEAPGTFSLVVIAANAEGLDKVMTSLQQSMKSHPLDGPAFQSMIDYTVHRDYLYRTTVTYK